MTWLKSVQLFASNRNSYFIEFADVNGLKEGDQVTVFGHPSGNVKEIRIGESGAIVEVGLDAEILLHEDVYAEILVKELMGGKQINIRPGRSGKQLSSGSNFIGNTSLDFSTAFSKLGDFLDRFGEEKLDTLFRSLNRIAMIYGDIGEQMKQEDMGELVRNVSSSVSSLNLLLGQMASRKMVMKVDSAMDKLMTMSGKADQALSSVTNLSDKLQVNTLPNADKLMVDLMHTLDETEGLITGVKDVLTQLKDTRTAAGRLLYDPVLNANLDYTLKNFNLTLDHLRTKKVMIAFTLSKKQPK